uniref:protein rep n=1 Tax=Macrococcoides caseolyticum TaxID=69966 RepID=UPI001642A964
TEVRVNKNEGSYNEDMDVLLCVESGYFKKEGEYIKESEWVDLWEKGLEVDYGAVGNMKGMKGNQKGDKDIEGGMK